MKAGWEVRPLGEVCRFVRGPFGGSLKKSCFIDSGFAVYEQQHAIYDQFSDIRYFVDETKFKEMERFELMPGDLIMSCSGTMGKVAVVPENVRRGIINQALLKLSPQSGLDVHFLRYWMDSPAFSEQLEETTVGVAIKNVASVKVLKTIDLTLPPLEEQKRIVAVLDAAFEGLTRAKENAETNLQNARELFEAALISVFSEIDGRSDQKLLKEVALDFGRGKSKHRPRNAPTLYGGPYPFVQTGDVRNAVHLITDHKQTYSEKGLAQSKLWPVGTLCITIAANIAETAILSFGSCFPDSIIGVVPDPEKTSSRYLEYLLQFFQKRLKARGEGAAQHNINLATFETEFFPFPGLVEQDGAIDALDKASSVVQSAEANYQAKLTDIADLRQSLLQKAFAGELT